MQAGTAYTERHSQVAGYKNIHSIYSLYHPKTRWEIPQEIVDHNKIREPCRVSRFSIQIDK